MTDSTADSPASTEHAEARRNAVVLAVASSVAGSAPPIAITLGGLAGLYLAQFAFGGLAGKLGFGTLAVLWLATGERAFHHAHHGNVAAHRRWMIRNFSLAFAAVMLRLYLPAAVVAGADFALAYAVIAWACWVPNLAFAEWWIRRRRPVAAG